LAGRHAPSDIKVTKHRNRLLCYNLTWVYGGNLSDLDTFKVTVRANGQLLQQEDTAGKCCAILWKLQPCEGNTITVKANYSDGTSTEESIGYLAEGS
jgi:hypothetical protein